MRGHRVAATLLLSLAGSASGVENLRVAAPGLFVGGAPAGEADWAELARLGVRTVVGVDGLAPDRDAAAAHAIRVVHVPLAYDGIDERSAAMLSRVARDAELPLYVYCHHGRHRGPAAAAIVGRAAGLLDADGATRLLHDAGTSPAYPGLWRDVAAFVPPSPDADLPALVERADASPLAIAMAQLDRAWSMASTSTNRGDDGEPTAAVPAPLVAAGEAMTEAVRAAIAEQRDPHLVAELRGASRTLHAAASARGAERAAAISEAGSACTACHGRWRDGR